MSKDTDNTEVTDEVAAPLETVVTTPESDLVLRLANAEKKIKILTILGSVAIAFVFLFGALGVAFKAGERHGDPERRFGERGPVMNIERSREDSGFGNRMGGQARPVPNDDAPTSDDSDN